MGGKGKKQRMTENVRRAKPQEDSRSLGKWGGEQEWLGQVFMNQCCVQLRNHNSPSTERGLYSIYIIPAHLFTLPDGKICIQTAEMHKHDYYLYLIRSLILQA